jgi:CHAD domain-containing protein
LTARQRHKLRVAAKKLRYAIELLGSLFDQAELQAFVKHLKRLQDDLGYANDVHVAHDLLRDLPMQGASRSAVGSAGAHMLEWHEKRLSRGERKLRKRLRRLNRAAPFWRGQERGGG